MNAKNFAMCLLTQTGQGRRRSMAPIGRRRMFLKALVWNIQARASDPRPTGFSSEKPRCFNRARVSLMAWMQRALL